MTVNINRLHGCALLGIAVIATAAATVSAQQSAAPSLNPSKMPKVDTVDARFASYNVEMVEVTGGRFWKPYKSATQADAAAKPNPATDANQQVGVSNSLFQYRSPIDLSNPRLRKLAANLGPAYVRVSGSWANSTYFQDDDLPA